MIKVVFSVLLCLAMINSRLLTPSQMRDMPFFQDSNDVTSVKTSCTKVVPADLDKAFQATQPIYAGYMNVAAGSNSGLAYIFYGSQKATKPEELANYPTIIWLNGGPGSSSQLGNFLELGPIHINQDGSTTLNKDSWNTEYNVMFVDQPIGTGYGFAATTGEIPTDQVTVGTQFFFALQEFLTGANGCVKTQTLPGLLSSPWFLFGESYAGKYVPAIAEQILAGKKTLDIPLRGIGIGDGFTDPLAVISEMPSFGFNMGLLDYQERSYDEKAALGGVLQIRHQDWLKAQLSFDATTDYVVKQGGGVNVYNIFVMGTYDALEAPVNTYLNSEATKTVLGFNKDIPFKMGSKPVYKALSQDFMKSDCVARVETVLKSLPVIIYNGQNDLIVPNPATLRWAYNLNHDKTTEFQQQDFQVWTLKDKVVGYKKSAGNLELRIVNQAGHLVPMDQPAAAFDMVHSFVQAHK